MRKKKILIQTNGTHVRTGLAENGRALASYLYKTGKYDIVYYATQTNKADPVLNLLPWKAYGSIPNDPHVIQQLNQDPGRARDVAYGSYYINDIVKKEKPDIVILSDDAWAFPLNTYSEAAWHSKLHPIYHITTDSIPILDQAFKQAERTKYFLTWAKFGAKEMKRAGEKYQHVDSIYGAIDLKDFSPVSPEKKKELRNKFGISDKTIIIGKVSRNQLRKEFANLLIAFAEYKKENPDADIKLHFHTSFSEKGAGWDLEKLIKYYNIDPKDILCTYVCRHCGDWTVEPYRGEDIDCAKCGAKKSRITANIQHGIPNEEMKFLYGLWDAGINVHTSGGQELNCCNTLLCGLPLACTNYASGEDFCEQSFVTAINFERRFEAGTSFLKASNSIKSIKGFYDKIYRMTPDKRREIGAKGYEWAKNTFSIDVIGPQWEKLFDSIPYVDWEGFTFEKELKNPTFELPGNYKEISEDDFLTLIYTGILKMVEPPDGEGRKSWKDQMSKGVTRDNVIEFFRKVAHDENNKNIKTEFWDLIDKDRPNKRIIFTIKESLGDCILVTQLFESLKRKYPDHDLYVSTSVQFMEVFAGNPYVHKTIPYLPECENEMLMTAAGQTKDKAYFDVFLMPAIQSQRHLNYLSRGKKLLELYAESTDLEIGNQFLLENFYPLPHDGKYITIQAASGMQSKNYAFYDEALEILHPVLEKHNVKFVQLGGEKDKPLKHCIHLQGKTSLYQTNYILSRALMHLGNDSFAQHRAGHLNIPLLVLFGATSAQNHGALQYHPRSIFLESHRNGKNPSFATQEFPLTINKIRPEEIVNATLKILGGQGEIGRKSLFVGQLYENTMVEWVPDTMVNPDFLKGQPLMCKFDWLEPKEEYGNNIFHALHNGRKLNLSSNKPLNIELLSKYKENILLFNFEINDDNTKEYEYIKALKRSGIKVRFFTKERDEKKLSDLRLKFLDVTTIEGFPAKTKENFENEAREYLNLPLDSAIPISDNSTWFRSNKYVISQGKIFLSKFMWKKDMNVPAFENNVMKVIDEPEFWEEIDHFYIFNQ